MNWICTINGVGNASGRAEGIKEGIEQGVEKGIEIGEERGIAKGREEGMSEGILQTAVAALKQGIPAETVASFTGLSVTEIEQLQSQI